MTLYAICRATVDLSKSITDHYVALFYRGGGGGGVEERRGVFYIII